MYDDLCRFLVGTRLIGEQVHTHGLAFGPARSTRSRTPPSRRTSGRPRPRALHEQLMILMDKWTAMLDNPRRDVRGRLARRSASLAEHRVRAEAERLLDLAGATR